MKTEHHLVSLPWLYPLQLSNEDLAHGADMGA